MIRGHTSKYNRDALQPWAPGMFPFLYLLLSLRVKNEDFMDFIQTKTYINQFHI